MFRTTWTRAALAIATLAASFALGTAAPALAAPSSGTPVSVSATVSQSITLTGLTTSVAFRAARPGRTASITGAESYTVATNDQANQPDSGVSAAIPVRMY